MGIPPTQSHSSAYHPMETPFLPPLHPRHTPQHAENAIFPSPKTTKIQFATQISSTHSISYTWSSHQLFSNLDPSNIPFYSLSFCPSVIQPNAAPKWSK